MLDSLLTQNTRINNWAEIVFVNDVSDVGVVSDLTLTDCSTKLFIKLKAFKWILALILILKNIFR